MGFFASFPTKVLSKIAKITMIAIIELPLRRQEEVYAVMIDQTFLLVQKSLGYGFPCFVGAEKPRLRFPMYQRCVLGCCIEFHVKAFLDYVWPMALRPMAFATLNLSSLLLQFPFSYSYSYVTLVLRRSREGDGVEGWPRGSCTPTIYYTSLSFLEKESSLEFAL